MTEGNENPDYSDYVYEQIQQESPEGEKLSYRMSPVEIYNVLKI